MTASVRICMIGAGRVGKLHSGTLKRHVPGGDVVALVDPWAEVRDATGDEFGIGRRFASLGGGGANSRRRVAQRRQVRFLGANARH